MTNSKTVRYYHAAIKLPLAYYFGMPPEEIHNRLLIKFALIEEKEDCYEVESTTGMSQERLSLFIENIWVWAMENGVPIEEYDSIGETTKIKIVNK